jgi:hypothetical protein
MRRATIELEVASKETPEERLISWLTEAGVDERRAKEFTLVGVRFEGPAALIARINQFYDTEC